MKLLLADDHTLFRDALVQYIKRGEPGFQVIVTGSFPEAMDVMNNDPNQDLVILDLRMPGMKGMEGFRIIRTQYPHVPVALMSGVAEKEDVQQALDLGARGYFPKTLSGKALLRAIQKVVQGDIFVPTENNTVMLSYYADVGDVVSQVRSTAGQDQDTAEPEINLTPREKEVLSYLVKGASNKEIARALGVQVVTVKLHVKGLCRKLEAKNRTQAALKGQALGLVSPNDQ